MNFKLQWLLSCILLAGCGGQNSVTTPSEDLPGGCGGYRVPNVTIYVVDATDDTFITSAETYSLVLSNDSSKFETYGTAYIASIDSPDLNFELSYLITAEGYADYFSSEYEYLVDTSCNAENSFVDTVRLCPIDFDC
jgi:hypothetical protein